LASLATGAALAAAAPDARDAGAHARVATSAGPTVYVDAQLPADRCQTYDPATRGCVGGGVLAFRTLARAAAATTPGVTVLIRGGVYQEPLVPPVSGEPDAPIVFRADEREPARIADLRGDLVGLRLIGRAHIVIEGLIVENVVGWGRLQDSQHIVIRRNTFRTATATGTTGGLKLVRSRLNRILDNRFEDGTDLIVLQDASDQNVLAGNRFVSARHSLLSVRCANANVVRDNSFANEFQKAVEIYDCEGVSDAPVRLDATKRNLFEGNRFSRTRGSYKPARFSAIQHGGQYTMVRRNVFSRALGGAISLAYYAEESLHVYGNRIYQNTFYENRCFAIEGGGADDRRYRDNRAVNNLLYGNADCEGGGAQTDIRDRMTVVLTGNGVETADPGFVDGRGNDFRLLPGSRAIDRGVALTTTRAAGQGTSLGVNDPLYFYDGFRIPGERGDEIRLVGSGETARVLHVDYTARLLTLDRPLTWTAGQGVALAYEGSAPDLGAFEFDSRSAVQSPAASGPR
jgi:hypothetical protein